MPIKNTFQGPGKEIHSQEEPAEEVDLADLEVGQSTVIAGVEQEPPSLSPLKARTA